MYFLYFSFFEDFSGEIYWSSFQLPGTNPLSLTLIDTLRRRLHHTNSYLLHSTWYMWISTFITQYLINFNIIDNCHDRNPIVLSRHKISYSSSSRELGLLEKIRDRDRERRELEKHIRSIVLFPDPLLIGYFIYISITILIPYS